MTRRGWAGTAEGGRRFRECRVVNLAWAMGFVGALAALAWAGSLSAGGRLALVVFFPYASAAVFAGGVILKVWAWARSAVPFRIPTTCGQQRSLSWIRSSRLENPHDGIGVVLRMALEVLLFRSLFRNAGGEISSGGRIVYREAKALWLAALAFHWSLLVIILRHIRFFLYPVPGFVPALERVDGIFELGMPAFLLSDAVVLAALAWLLLRRVLDPRLRYLSLFSDYLALSLLVGTAGTGILLRYLAPVDLAAVKLWALGLAAFTPGAAPAGGLFFIHIALVCALLAYFPFSKLMHAGGVFLSPTRNLANNSRMKRHVNPWNPAVRIHGYEEWESEFRDKIKAAGLPLERP